MRPSALPNLLNTAREALNRGVERTALFECGPVFASPEPAGQSQVAAGIRAGTHVPRHWATGGTARAADVFDAKADALAVLEACGAPASPQITRDAPSYYHPGRSGCLRLGKSVLATFGELHPDILESVDLDGPVAAFEIYPDAIPVPKSQKGPAKPLLKLPSLQPVRRDFAFLVDNGVESADVVQAVKGAEKGLIADVAVFDVYRGKGVPEGKKSLALSVTLQPRDETLTDAELEGLSRKIVSAVQNKTGGVQRG